MRKTFDRPLLVTYTKEYTPENHLDTSIYIDYRNHLLENKQHILDTGYPKAPFKRNLNLDLSLSKTYPTKIPLHITGDMPFYRNMDYLGNTPDIYKEVDTFTYIWSKLDPLSNFKTIYNASGKISPKALVKNILPTVPNEEIVPYDEAEHLGLLTENEIIIIEESRDTLFSIKLRILDLIIEFTEGKIPTAKLLENGLKTVSEKFTLNDLLLLLKMDEKYEQRLVRLYLNKLLIPRIHPAQQIIGLKNIIIDENSRTKPIALLNCGGISDILYTVGNIGEAKIFDMYKKKRHGGENLFYKIHQERTEYWKLYKYKLEKFLEKQMERDISITTKLKGEYVEKYLPMLERIISAQTDHINEFGTMFDDSDVDKHNRHNSNFSPQYLFRKAGEGFEIVFNGKPPILIKDSVGMHYIQFLLSDPNNPIPIQELYSIRQQPSSDQPKHHDYGSLTAIRESSSKEYDAGDFILIRNKLNTLIQEKEEANESHNYARAEDIQREIEEITAHLKKSKNAKRDPQLEKMRTSVTNAIGNTIKRIRQQDPKLAQHLKEKISTGYQCLYTNDPADNITWIVR